MDENKDVSNAPVSDSGKGRGLVVGVSSRSLFSLEAENSVFENEGVEIYRQYQRQREDTPLMPGAGFPLVRALLALNAGKERVVDIVVMSRNTPDTGLRVLNSIKHHGLDIGRASFVGGAGQAPYLEAFNVDLFLSKSPIDVQEAVDAGCPAAQIYDLPSEFQSHGGEIRIAFDGDAVLFSDESEAIYQSQGLAAFAAHEAKNAYEPLSPGPFAKLLLTLSWLQHHRPGTVRIALVTARGGPSHERVIRTLRTWNVNIDEAFFLGGLKRKAEVLKAFGAHIFFDDQDVHLDGSRQVVPSAKVPYKTGSSLHEANVTLAKIK